MIPAAGPKRRPRIRICKPCVSVNLRFVFLSIFFYVLLVLGRCSAKPKKKKKNKFCLSAGYVFCSFANSHRTCPAAAEREMVLLSPRQLALLSPFLDARGSRASAAFVAGPRRARRSAEERELTAAAPFLHLSIYHRSIPFSVAASTTTFLSFALFFCSAAVCLFARNRA